MYLMDWYVQVFVFVWTFDHDIQIEKKKCQNFFIFFKHDYSIYQLC